MYYFGQSRHLSTPNPLHEDTFLMELPPQELPQSLLSICCETHKQMAVFYSNQQQKYKCFKCLLEEQDLIYIDKKFKNEMEEFERIKKQTAEMIKNNSGRTDMMRQWKSEIRRCLINVRNDFIKWVDTFTQQFINSLKDIERSKDLADFQGIDFKLSKQLNELRDSYVDIIKVFTSISNTTVEKQVETIDSHRKTMKDLEKKIQEQNYNINTKISKLITAQNKTVSLEGLNLKVYQKYIKYFDKKINQQKTGQNNNDSLAISMMYSAQSSQKNHQATKQNSLRDSMPQVESRSSPQLGVKSQIESSNRASQLQANQPKQKKQFNEQPKKQEMILDTIDLSGIQRIDTKGNADASLSFFPELDMSPRVFQQTDNANNARLTSKALSQLDSKHQEEQKGQDNRRSSYNQRETTQSVDQSTISYRYRHKNQNSIYYLKPRSNEIYLLDFKMQGFIKEQITSKTLIPASFSSCQLQSGSIYVIGGIVSEFVSRNCMELDANMNMIEKEPMKLGRYNIALALVIDKFIFAIGGNSGKQKPSDVVEVYDTAINVWYPVGSLNKARSCTSACAISHRFLYVFPGQQSNTWNTIEQLDLGASLDLKEMKKLKWQMFTVSNQEMQATFAYGSVHLQQNELMIFGGSKSSCFMLDYSQLNPKDKKKEAKFVTLKNSPLCMDAWFSYDSDFVARVFGNYLYAIDSHSSNLHVYSLKDKIWNFSALKDLGVN